jgi:hypothetical protein
MSCTNIRIHPDVPRRFVAAVALARPRYSQATRRCALTSAG